MTASVQSPADLVNIALSRIGHQGRVGSLLDGSMTAKRALDLYGQTRDELLRAHDWGFAERTSALTLLKSMPPGGYVPPLGWTSAYPPPPWRFEYLYPSDCLKLRAVKQVSIWATINPDPCPNVFSIANDGQRVILTDLAYAVAVYTGQVTDPTQWDTMFTEALIAALARRLAAAFGVLDQGKAEAEKDEDQDEQGAAGSAAMIQG